MQDRHTDMCDREHHSKVLATTSKKTISGTVVIKELATAGHVRV